MLALFYLLFVIIIINKLFFSGPIGPNESYTTPPISVRFYRSGYVTVVADFDSKEIYNIKASKKIEVVR